MIAIGLVIVHANAGGQGQRFDDPPFIFKEQRVLAGGGGLTAAAQIDRVFQLIVTPFAAEGQQLVNHSQRQNVFAVHRVTLRSDGPGLTRIFIIHFLAVEFQLAIADIPAAVVAQGVVLALEAVAIKRVGIPILAIKPVACGHVLIISWRPGEFDVAVAAGETFNTRRFARCVAGSLLIVLGALCQATVGLHPQHAVNQRAAGKELTVVRIAAIAMFLNGGVRAEGAGPLLADFFGDDIHHAAEGVGTIE